MIAPPPPLTEDFVKIDGLAESRFFRPYFYPAIMASVLYNMTFISLQVKCVWTSWYTAIDWLGWDTAENQVVNLSWKNTAAIAADRVNRYADHNIDLFNN